MLAFVDIFVESAEIEAVIDSLYQLENLEELYEVTGEFDLTILVSASDIEELRSILNRITKMPGVKSTVSSVVLNVYKGSKKPVDELATPEAEGSHETP